MTSFTDTHTFSLLLADDDANMRASLKRVLRRLDCKIVEAANGLEAQKKISDEISVALIDSHMPKASGLDFLAYANKKFPNIPVVILSGKAGIADVVHMMDRGAYWYLSKPYDTEELLALLTRAWSFSELRKHNERLRSGFRDPQTQTFVSKSPVMSDLIEKVEKLCQLDSTVLLTGETGTGKTSLARLIHQRSKRKNENFIAINCAAVPRDLLESELFGHEKGAFTGAHAQRAGSIELADGGTLFLDEIGDMPLELQPKLLSFLQDGTFRRVGGSKEIKVDTRVVTATNRDLDLMCKEKCFREDLYYRVNVLSLQMPPLRRRKEDLELLTDSILQRISAKREVPDYKVSQQAREILAQHDWPGNIRELENVLERATAFASSQELSSSDLHLPEISKTKAAGASTDILEIKDLTLEQIEEKVLLHALECCEGNKTRVAKSLGISPKSVYNKLQKYNIT